MSGPDHGKLDAALAAALDRCSDGGERLPLFVHLEPGRADEEVLAALGVEPPPAGGDVATASLSPGQVAALSAQPWVRHLRLSTRLRPHAR